MDYPRYEIFRDAKKEFRFRLKSKNYEIILTASEGYDSKYDCQNAISICQRNSPYDVDYDRRTTQSGKPYFVLRSDNKKDIGRSEDYSSVTAREEGIKDVKRDGPTKTIVDQTLVNA
ncbi:MAG TPA: YegP family protein [Flavitalea sp.]|nr:YegP family protein [Flavitalea sp.]